MMGFINALPGAAAQGLIWGIMAIGIYITYKILDIADLTVDGSFGTGGAVFVISMIDGRGIAVSMILAFVAGCLAGLATGLLHTFFGIPAILAGILSQLGLYSVNLAILGGANKPISDRKYPLLVNLKNIYPSFMVAIIFVIVIIGFLYWFFGTELGHALRATGCNQAMARANGINTDTNKIIAIVLSNGLVALSGALLSQWQGFADVGMGRGAIVIGLAAVIIGEVLFGKIFKNFALRLFGVACGSIVYYIVYTLVLRFLQRLNIKADWMKFFSALVVAIFLAVPYCKKKWRDNYGQKNRWAEIRKNPLQEEKQDAVN